MTPGNKLLCRAAMADYLLRCERMERIIHYDQVRPMRSLGQAPEHGMTMDCSEYVTATYFWAWKHNPKGILVPDPNGNNYDGVGNTTTLRVHNTNRVPLDHKFFVGDMAQYRNENHVTICRKEGNMRTAIFSSHGREAGPVPTQLWSYRRDELLYVCRSAAFA